MANGCVHMDHGGRISFPVASIRSTSRSFEGVGLNGDAFPRISLSSLSIAAWLRLEISNGRSAGLPAAHHVPSILRSVGSHVPRSLPLIALHLSIHPPCAQKAPCDFVPSYSHILS